MTQDPDQIRQQIETTRSTLSSDVNALAETVRPSNVARRQVDKVKDAATSAKEKVMGAAPDLGSARDTVMGSAPDLGSARVSAGGALGQASDTLSGVASSSQDAVRAVPGAVTSKAQGNPLAAGLIAFGAGWLVSSLIPATRQEEQLGAKVKENASVVTEQLSGAAREVGEHLREPAQDAVQSVRSTATDAADHVRSEGTSAAQDVKDQGLQAKDTVQQSRS